MLSTVVMDPPLDLWEARCRGGEGWDGASHPFRKLRPDHSLLVLSHVGPSYSPLYPCSFRNFDVEESHQCSLDWLMLGPAAPPRQEAFRLCGSAIPPAFISARDHVWIFFHSDASSSGQAQGFRLSYIRGDTGSRGCGAPCELPGSEQYPPLAHSLQSPTAAPSVVGPGLLMSLPQAALEPLEVTDPNSQTWLEWGHSLTPSQARD